jgi:hypothetical protein
MSFSLGRGFGFSRHEQPLLARERFPPPTPGNQHRVPIGQEFKSRRDAPAPDLTSLLRLPDPRKPERGHGRGSFECC